MRANLTKAAAIALLRRGEATPAEVMQLASVSRMTAWRWARDAGDWESKRLDRLAASWRRELNGARPKPTKRQLRKKADAAKVEWDLRHEGDGST